MPLHANRPVRWKKIQTPKPWKPREPATLEGEYMGYRQNNGSFGQYTSFFIKTHEGVYYVSGAVLTSLITSAGLEQGDLIRVEFTGWIGSAEKPYRDYDLYVVDARVG